MQRLHMSLYSTFVTLSSYERAEKQLKLVQISHLLEASKADLLNNSAIFCNGKQKMIKPNT